jgi:hypothetical protein
LATPISSNPFVVVFVGIVLFLIGRVIIRRISESERDPWLAKALTACLIIHLICAPLQIWVVDHLYQGIADYNRYDTQGSLLAPGFRHLDFSLAPGNLPGIVADGSVSIVTGVVFAIVGVNQAAAFLVFSFLAFIGVTYFYRAFTVTFSGMGNRRYGYVVFFLPSLMFWTSDVGKEALMVFLLGLTAYGCAMILARRGGAKYWVLILACSVGGAFIRPNQMVLAVGGFAIAMIFRPTSATTRYEPGRRTLSLILLGGMVGVAIFVTLNFLPGLHGSLSLTTIAANNSAANNSGAGFGSTVAYSASPVYYWRDVYVVLLDPLPFNAHGGGEWLEAFENMVLVVFAAFSLRQLRILPRAGFARPYVILCGFFVASFCYAFAALGNLGLITRESVVLSPFLLVLFCIPRGPRYRPPRYIWELRRRDRVARRRLQARHARGGAPRRALQG